MNREKIEYLCKCRSVLSGIPIALYENGEQVYRHEQIPLNEDIYKNVYPMLANTEKDINYIALDNLNVFGIIKDKSDPFAVVIGPSKSTELSDSEIKKEMFTLGLDLSHYDTFVSYLSLIPTRPINYFFLMLSEINMYINGEILKVYDFINIDNETYLSDIGDSAENLNDHIDNITFGESLKHSTSEFENQMLHYIKNGMTEKLKDLFANVPPGRVGNLATNQLRQDKNGNIVAIALVTRAAIAGGLNEEMAYQLSDIYIQKIESCTSVNQVLQLGLMAMLDFSERVHALSYHETNSPMVDRAIKFIVENVNQKISVNDVAAKLNVNRGYLSTKFKSTTGINLVDYINLQKIMEAKRLVRYSDKSLAEISNYLAFSSQSYFQNMFKKITGMTPLSYRSDRTAE